MTSQLRPGHTRELAEPGRGLAPAAVLLLVAAAYADLLPSVLEELGGADLAPHSADEAHAVAGGGDATTLRDHDVGHRQVEHAGQVLVVRDAAVRAGGLPEVLGWAGAAKHHASHEEVVVRGGKEIR